MWPSRQSANLRTNVTGLGYLANINKPIEWPGHKCNSCLCKYLQVVQALCQVQVLKPQGQSQEQAPDLHVQVQVFHFCAKVQTRVGPRIIFFSQTRCLPLLHTATVQQFFYCSEQMKCFLNKSKRSLFSGWTLSEVTELVVFDIFYWSNLVNLGRLWVTLTEIDLTRVVDAIGWGRRCLIRLVYFL